MTTVTDDLFAVDAAGGWLGPCWRSPVGHWPARRVFFWCWTTGEDRCE